MNRLIFPAAFVILLSACASRPPLMGHNVVVVAQVCFPVHPSNTPSVAFVSEGAARRGGKELNLKTVSGQSAFMAYGDEPGLGKALIVSTDEIHYQVFAVPQNDSGHDSWGSWQLPEFETTEAKSALRMARGQVIEPKSPPDESGPYARFKLMQFVDYLSFMKIVKTEHIPGCGAQLGTQADGQRFALPAA